MSILLKIGTKDDYPYVEKMAYAAIEAYSLLPQDTLNKDFVKEYAFLFLDRVDNKIAVLSYEDGYENPPAGALGLELVFDGLNNSYVAVERFLWVNPEYRNKGHRKELLGAAEYLARKFGAKQLQVSRQDTENKKFNKALDKTYKDNGFILRDYNYVKDLK